MVYKILFFFWAVVSMTLFACNKASIDEMHDGVVNLSSVGVVNAVPGSSGMDVFVNSTRINNTSDKLFFGEHIPYRNTYSGDVEFALTSYSGTKQEVHKEQLTFHPNRVYSVFVYREGGLKLLQSEDNVLLPAKGQAKLRVVHLGGNVASMKVFSDERNVIFQRVGYKEVSSFINLPINIGYNLEITDENSDVTLELSFEPQNQGIYTLLIKGNKNNVGAGETGLEAKIIKH
ncbi:DUF4397 domain-containing protein [Sphingobacterium alkalisoli]|uniref:DUF4397 domain-containing protein n=1 Tax=Sphingobacterium alkalisoli TaxID=1874115 RepID=A0A4U0HA69_9SPHI|nr:DUF4397 domain-containing protein [Sphingobacterium alkalisoli]TJY68696.1 DUF4397 domain-containing protein [Sphingobacterium alkalisoli]